MQIRKTIFFNNSAISKATILVNRDISICLLLLFMISSLIGQNCNIQLDEKIDLKTFRAKSIELHQQFNIFIFYGDLRKCELISEFDYRVMHDANLLDKIRNNIYDNSIDSIVTYSELLIQFNLEMKTNEFIEKKEQIVIWDNLLSEILQSPICLLYTSPSPRDRG